jgi:5-methylcytosine-specific restriction protein B
MLGPIPASGNLSDALRYVGEGWKAIRAHIDEVFFGDLRGTAAALNVGQPNHVYSLEERTFADEPRHELVGPETVPDPDLYQLLRAVAEP